MRDESKFFTDRCSLWITSTHFRTMTAFIDTDSFQATRATTPLKKTSLDKQLGAAVTAHPVQ